MSDFAHLALAASFLGALMTVYYKGRRRNRGPRPPGPKGYPLIGNLFDMPFSEPWLKYDEWAKQYGDVVYLDFLGQPFMVLCSQQSTNDLLEKRSTIYSDRPRLPMVFELMRWDFNFGIQPYGSWWRRHRRRFHQEFQSSAISKYQLAHTKASRKFLLKLLANPDQLGEQIRHNFSATIMEVVYGIVVEDKNDQYVETAEEAVRGLSEAGILGRYWVDLFPWMKYIPEWMPGAIFQRKAGHWRKVNHDMVNKPFDVVQEKLSKGTAAPSVAAGWIESLPNDETRKEEEEVARNCAGVAFAAGADTTVSHVHSFVMAMAMYPGVQRKAQEEIDRVVGPNRIPDFGDQDSLPYVGAIVKESLRWKLAFPLAVPHATSEDDVYNGYFIPRGSVVLGNAFSILHNPAVYPEPDEFRPERWLLPDGELNPEMKDPDAAFGFGRRICAGKFYAVSSMYSIISAFLSTFTITPTLDENGEFVKLGGEMTSGLISYPIPFASIIKPRSATAENLIREAPENKL